MYNLQSTITKNIQIKSEVFEMALHAPEITQKAKPGQFIEIKVNDTSVLLRRPMSIMDADHKTGEIKIWYRVVGAGTLALSMTEAGKKLDIIGPLGNMFYLKPEAKTVVLVGGGCGVAPLVYFSKHIQSNSPDVKIYAIIGARTKEFVLGSEAFQKYGAQVLISTDDGSEGTKGFPTTVLQTLLEKEVINEAATCGPNPMMMGIARLCQDKNIFCLVSMESPMACGLGACYGCVVKTKIGYRRVCKEGPIFKGTEVLVD